MFVINDVLVSDKIFQRYVLIFSIVPYLFSLGRILYLHMSAILVAFKMGIQLIIPVIIYSDFYSFEAII